MTRPRPNWEPAIGIIGIIFPPSTELDGICSRLLVNAFTQPTPTPPPFLLDSKDNYGDPSSDPWNTDTTRVVGKICGARARVVERERLNLPKIRNGGRNFDSQITDLIAD